jgi:hypothetical protein
MSRLTVLLLLTGAFAPAAVMGALPIVLPVMVVVAGIGLAVSAFEPVPVEVADRPAAVRRGPAHRRPR